MSINIRRVCCGLIQENCYIVRAEGRDDCVVIDPGDEYPKLKRALGDQKVELLPNSPCTVYMEMGNREVRQILLTYIK